MKSIRGRLTAGLLATLLPLLAAGGIGLYLHVRGALLAQFDADLASRARILSALVVRSGEGIEVEVEEGGRPALWGDGESECLHLTSSGGDTILRSPSLAGADLPRRGGTLENPLFWDHPLPDGRPGRAVGVRFAPALEEGTKEGPIPAAADSREEVLLVLARDRAAVDRPVAVLLPALLVGGLALLGAAGVAAARVVKRGLRPLSRLADRAATIEPTTLASRFPQEGLPAELAPICERLNDLLGRLEEAFERERRFTADAAHELRTPIAELRSLAEVALRFPGDREASGRAFEDALDIARHMERLVGALLDLARCDGGRRTPAPETVELAALVEEAWRPLEEAARERGLLAEMDLRGAGTIVTDRPLAHAIVANLLSNAVTHAPRGGRIESRGERRDGAVEWTLANTNDSLLPADIPHLFERFWRKDPARIRSWSAGLGLSVVAAFARLLGAEVRAELPDPKWFRVTVRFSAVAPPRTVPSSTLR